MHIGQNMEMMEKMIKTISSFAKVFFIVDLIVVIFSLFQEDVNFLLNTQVAFISSLFILLATFLSYQKNVSRRLDGLDVSLENLGQRDKIDELDDPYDLYSDDEIITEQKELSAEEIKTILKEEKSRVKKNSFKNTIFSGTAFISIYRVLGYSTLVFGFFYLTNNILFNPFGYMLGLFVVPASALCMGFVLRKS